MAYESRFAFLVRIYLRNSNTGRYYAGTNEWTSDSADTMDLRQVERALRLNLEECLGATEVVLSYENPPCNVRLAISEPASNPLA